jgi:hypothetical protein
MNLESWPPGTLSNHPLTDDEALTMAKLILDGKPRSYVEGAQRLAHYVLTLHQQAEDIERMIDETRDTIPSSP